MTDAVIVGDIHITDPAGKPTSRTSNYTQEILDKIRFVALFAKDKGVPLVLAGDVFHVKTPSKNSHKLIQQVHDALEDVPTFIVPGNHDLSNHRLESLAKQPLGALARMHNVNLLIGEHEDLPGIAGIPFMPSFDEGNLYWPEQLRYNPFDLETPELIVTHAPFFPSGKEPNNWKSMSIEIWADIHLGIKATYYGHIHDHHGTFTDKDGDMQFCNQGALSRGSLTESNVNRKPAVTYWDGSTFTRIEVPHKAPEEVFLFDEAAIKKRNTASAKEFKESVEAVQIGVLTVEDLAARLKTEVSDPLVLKIMLKSLEE